MSRVTVVTDSSTLFAPGEAKRLGVAVVPVPVALDGDPYEEEVHGTDGFYDRLERGAEATSSQPSPGALLETYTRAAEKGAREVVSIHLDARLSGTIRSAELAAREAPLPVTVVDSRSVSFGVGVCVQAAVEALADGATAADAAVAALRRATGMGNAFVAGGGRSGRLPASKGWSLLAFEDGTAVPISSVATLDRACAAILSRVARAKGSLHAAVGHAAAVTERPADELAAELSALIQVRAVERYRVAPAVGTHTGADCFGAFWWPVADG